MAGPVQIDAETGVSQGGWAGVGAKRIAKRSGAVLENAQTQQAGFLSCWRFLLLLCFLFLLFFYIPPCKHISCFSRSLGESRFLFYSRMPVAEILALACARRFTWRYEAVEATDRQVPGTCTCTSVVQHVVRITEFNRGKQ